MATIGLSYLRADLALNECRRQQVALDYKEDMKVRSAAWQARKQATEKVAAAHDAIDHPELTRKRSAHETVVRNDELPTSASAIATARHDGTYSREQGHAGAAPTKADK